MKKNKSSKSNKNKKIHLSPKKFLILAIITLNIVWLGVLTYNQRQDRERIAIHDLMAFISSATNTSMHRPAMDEKTGDVYFPDMKLKIQNNDQTKSLIYGYYEIDGEKVINITTAQLIKIQTGYGAKNTNELLNIKISDIQSCARGIRVAYTKADTSDDNLVTSEKTLSNGIKLYLSYEKRCSDLSTIFDTVKKIDSY